MKRFFILSSICLNLHAQPMNFNRLLSEANMWQKQQARPREDIEVNIQTGLRSPDGENMVRIALYPVGRPLVTIGVITYITDQEAKIRHLKVDPAYQGQGLASVLLGAALSHCRRLGYPFASFDAQPINDYAFWTPEYQRTLERLAKFYEVNGAQRNDIIEFQRDDADDDHLYPYAIKMVFDLVDDPTLWHRSGH